MTGTSCIVLYRCGVQKTNRHRLACLPGLHHLRTPWRAAMVSADGRSQKAVGPLLGELPRACEHHRHFWIADCEPAQHVSQPGAAAGLGANEVRVVSLHDNCCPGELRQTLDLKGEASVRE